MSNGLTIKNDLDIMSLGQVLVRSGFFQDSNDAAKAVVKVLAGRELGFGPIASMTGINVIKGRVTLSANLMAAAIKRTGKYNYRVARLDDTACELTFFENGEQVGESHFTIEDARSAGLGGDNWRRFPRNMLFARALSNGAKWYCPDIFGGPVYTPDEMGAVVDENGEVINYDDDAGEEVPPDGQPRVITPTPPANQRRIPGPTPNPRAEQEAPAVPPQAHQQGQHAQEGAQAVQPAANGENAPQTRQDGQGAAQGGDWTADIERVKSLVSKAQQYWADNGYPTNARRHTIYRVAQALGVVGAPSTNDELRDFLHAQITLTPDEAWKAIQLYEPSVK